MDFEKKILNGIATLNIDVLQDINELVSFCLIHNIHSNSEYLLNNLGTYLVGIRDHGFPLAMIIKNTEERGVFIIMQCSIIFQVLDVSNLNIASIEADDGTQLNFTLGDEVPTFGSKLTINLPNAAVSGEK